MNCRSHNKSKFKSKIIYIVNVYFNNNKCDNKSGRLLNCMINLDEKCMYNKLYNYFDKINLLEIYKSKIIKKFVKLVELIFTKFKVNKNRFRIAGCICIKISITFAQLKVDKFNFVYIKKEVKINILSV